VIFGDKEDYFANGPFITFRNGKHTQIGGAVWAHPTDHKTPEDGVALWNLEVKDIFVKQQEELDLKATETIAYFDSTSQFNYISKDLLAQIVSKINNSADGV
jgi:hypothetical protein